GYADRAFKLPNPTYFLPSPNLTPAPGGDAAMVPPSEYTMAPDGSSGETVPGDAIPNIDLVRNEIRAYYGAGPGTLPDGTEVTQGIADKESSPYIDEMEELADTWTQQLTGDCEAGVAAHDQAEQDLADAQDALAAAQKKLSNDKAALAIAKSALKKSRAKLTQAKKRLAKAKTPKAKRAARREVAKWTKAVARAEVAVRTLKKRVNADRNAVKQARAALDAIEVPGLPAAVYDADDTTLWTYD